MNARRYLSHLNVTAMLLTLAVASTSSVWAQVPPAGSTASLAPGPRKTSVAIGFGNMFGGVGATAEYYLLSTRLSGVVGLGFLAETSDNPGTTGVAVAVRGYTPGLKHRGFVELSASLIEISWTKLDGEFLDVKRHYGPGFSLGYHYTAGGGFTFLVAGGAGWVVDRDKLGP